MDRLTCHRLQNGRDWKEILNLPRSEVITDWQGNRLSKPYRYSIGKDSEFLVFVADVPLSPPASRPEQYQEFVNDLAEPATRGQTAELFVMRTEDHYFEIHISPDGGWWYKSFIGYRQRDPESPIPKADIFVERKVDGWTAAISLPLKELSVELSDGVMAQATLGVCDRDLPCYITTAGTPDFEPDFHNKRAFACLEIK
jgi:hypothetical protein